MNEMPDQYLLMAEEADRWCESHGQELFPGNGAMTLERFYRDYYVPNCLTQNASENYLYQWEVVLKRWRLATGDPPLENIDTVLLGKFRHFLTGCRGLTPGSKLSGESIKRYLTYVTRLLAKAGPSGYRNRDAAELIPKAPWIKPPPIERKAPRIVPLETLTAVFEHADCMAVPTIAGLSAPVWWRALLVLAYNTGLRRIQTEDDVVFPWPYNPRYFDQAFHRLQYDAGIPWKAHFGFRELRRTYATQMWKHCPEAARLGLGHTFDKVTRDHYINGPAIVADALDKLPQPEAFTAEP